MLAWLDGSSEYCLGYPATLSKFVSSSSSSVDCSYCLSCSATFDSAKAFELHCQQVCPGHLIPPFLPRPPSLSFLPTTLSLFPSASERLG
jgi:hypothetical protein